MLGLTEEDVDRGCADVTCGGLPAAGCKLDSCDDCQVYPIDEAGNRVDVTKCEIPVPEVCPTTVCPDMGEPDCGERPTECPDDWQLRCIIDQCACRWRWFSADLRLPAPFCSQALQECYLPQDCPIDYNCPAPSESITSQVETHILDQLDCVQETCSCKPILAAPAFGVRDQCTDDEIEAEQCCKDGLTASPECPEGAAQFNCERVSCEVDAANCAVDGCNSCGLIILDPEGEPIPHEKCKVDLTSEMYAMCATVTCPPGVEDLVCPPRPACFPEDWKLTCIVDPCACRAIWVNEDTRNLSPTCDSKIRAPLVDVKDCPKDYYCPPIDQGLLDSLEDPAIADRLTCVQEPGTCRPILTAPEWLPIGFRLPCGENRGRECCDDGEGPVSCAAGVAENTCANSVCNGKQPASCKSNGCNQCNVQLFDEEGSEYDVFDCTMPVGESKACADVVCPEDPGIDCPPRPDECPEDWHIRCIRDPCTCNRKIWVDEDVRFTPKICSDALIAPCTDDCPTDFSCPDLPEFGFACVQEKCTCRPVAVRMVTRQEEPQQEA